MSTGKAANNDWKAASSWEGEGIEISVSTEGNEAEGEVPHTNAGIYIGQYLSDDECDIEPGDAGTKEEIKKAIYEGEKVVMKVWVGGSREVVEEHGDAIIESAEEAIPDDWDKK